MLSILSDSNDMKSYCDNKSRRSFLQLGGMTFGATSFGLADLYRAEAAQGKSHSHKAVIQIFLGGGPPHQDMWEIKTEAPSEIRGEFRPISTNVPGIQICEVFPKLAGMMDKAVVIRSIVGCFGRHDAFQCMSGWQPEDLRSIGGRPSIGAAMTKLRGPVDPSVPAFVGLAEKSKHVEWSDCGGPGFLGASYSAFRPDGPGMDNMKLNGLSLERLQNRKQLLASLDKLRSDIDTSGVMAGMDTFNARAVDVLTSSKLVDALDLSKEDPAIVARYGDGKPYQFQFDGVATRNDHLLVARRLVEAGVRVVSLGFGRWDSHSKNFDMVRDHGSKLDQSLSALIEDLDQRGMLNDVSIVVWGEFGRTPKINSNAGRDHWSQVSCAYLAGGGIRAGQAIGSTNRLGEYATERPVHVQEVLATLYHNLGINVSNSTLVDSTGRPQYLVEREPIQELI
jgi:Protein of unknown function (DUF1501)